MAFARALGYPANRQPVCQLSIGPQSDETRVGLGTIVIAPGCKTRMMAAKRWPTSRSSPNFQDVAIVGTPDDLSQHDGRPMPFPAHARSFVGQLTLRETAELMAAAGAVVVNDAGLAHVARGRHRWHSHGHHAVRPDRRSMPRSPSGQCHGDACGLAVRALLDVFAASVMPRQDLVPCRAAGRSSGGGDSRLPERRRRDGRSDTGSRPLERPGV